MKRICLISIVLVLIVISLLAKSHIILYINWKIYLPKPINEKRIYEHDFTDGENFYIWSYDIKKYDKKILQQGFKKIDENNINELIEKMDNYYDKLDNKEKTLYWDNVSWNSLDLSELLKYKNYYYCKIKNGGNDTLLIITDIENNCMYIFESYY